MQIEILIAGGLCVACVFLLGLYYIVKTREEESPLGMEDAYLNAQIKLWKDGITRLKNAQQVDRALGDETLSASKTEIVDIVKDYQIIKRKKK
jgi:hypothetical protein